MVRRRVSAVSNHGRGTKRGTTGNACSGYPLRSSGLQDANAYSGMYPSGPPLPPTKVSPMAGIPRTPGDKPPSGSGRGNALGFPPTG